jgi:phosphomannomutase
MTAPFKKYFSSGEINFKVKDKEKILKELEKNPPGGGETGKILKMDGLRINFKDWWFLVRPSNTEPLLRLVIEGKSKELVEEKTHLLSDILNG